MCIRDRHEIRHLFAGDGQAPEPVQGVCFVDALMTIAPQLANLERPWLGPFRKADHELLLPGIAHAGSIALIPLRRHDELDGVLVFVSTDPQRFTPELASCLLYTSRAGRLVLGVSSAPVYGELAWAEEGEGAWLNERAIRVSGVTALADAVVSSGNLKTLSLIHI